MRENLLVQEIILKKKKFCFQYSKKLRRLVKMEDKLQKPHFKNSNLLIG